MEPIHLASTKTGFIFEQRQSLLKEIESCWIRDIEIDLQISDSSSASKLSDDLEHEIIFEEVVSLQNLFVAPAIKLRGRPSKIFDTRNKK